MKVIDLILENSKGWNMELLTQLFHGDTIAITTNIHLAQVSQPYEIILLASSPHKFSTKSFNLFDQKEIFTSLANNNFSQVNWKQLWKMKIHERFKIFRCANNCLSGIHKRTIIHFVISSFNIEEYLFS